MQDQGGAARLLVLFRTMARIRAFEDAAEIASQGGVQAWGLAASATPVPDAAQRPSRVST